MFVVATASEKSRARARFPTRNRYPKIDREWPGDASPRSEQKRSNAAFRVWLLVFWAEHVKRAVVAWCRAAHRGAFNFAEFGSPGAADLSCSNSDDSAKHDDRACRHGKFPKPRPQAMLGEPRGLHHGCCAALGATARVELAELRRLARRRSTPTTEPVIACPQRITSSGQRSRAPRDACPRLELRRARGSISPSFLRRMSNSRRRSPRHTERPSLPRSLQARVMIAGSTLPALHRQARRRASMAASMVSRDSKRTARYPGSGDVP